MDIKLILLLSVFFSLGSCQCPTVADPAIPGNYYDLSPLTDNEIDYQCPNTRYPTYTFYLNVCRPLVMIDTSCVAGTGICEKSTLSSSKIGSLSSSFTVVSPGRLTMLYPAGSGCFSGKVNFLCKPGSGRGAPIYTSENCEYTFDWETEHACSKSSNPTNPPPSPQPVSLGSLLEDLIEGKTVKVFYDFSRCSNQLASVGGATVQSYQYFTGRRA